MFASDVYALVLSSTGRMRGWEAGWLWEAAAAGTGAAVEFFSLFLPSALAREVPGFR